MEQYLPEKQFLSPFFCPLPSICGVHAWFSMIFVCVHLYLGLFIKKYIDFKQNKPISGMKTPKNFTLLLRSVSSTGGVKPKIVIVNLIEIFPSDTEQSLS